MKLYKNITDEKSKMKYNKRKQNSKQLKKNKSLTYYHFDGQINHIKNFPINHLKINDKNKCNYNKNSKNNSKDINNNSSFNYFYNNENNNNVIILKAYKKSIFELFKTLKLNMNKELYKYYKIKKEFFNNIQKFYTEEKKKDKKLNRNNTQIYSKQKLKENKFKSQEINKNNSGCNSSMNKTKTDCIKPYDNLIKTYKYSNNLKLNKKIEDNSIKYKAKICNLTSGLSFIQERNNNNNEKSYFKKHISLYSLLKKNTNIIGNSPVKNSKEHKNDNPIKKFIKYSQNICDKKNNKTYNQSVISDKNELISEKERNNGNINKEKIYKISERLSNNNDELISKIKDSLDDNLKHILNFSYENFLNKETERECN